jgi:hypothetical protein
MIDRSEKPVTARPLFAPRARRPVCATCRGRGRALGFPRANEPDWTCPPDHSRLIGSGIANAWLVIAPNTDHAVPSDIPLKKITTLLANHPCAYPLRGTCQGGDYTS